MTQGQAEILGALLACLGLVILVVLTRREERAQRIGDALDNLGHNLSTAATYVAAFELGCDFEASRYTSPDVIWHPGCGWDL